MKSSVVPARAISILLQDAPTVENWERSILPLMLSQALDSFLMMVYAFAVSVTYGIETIIVVRSASSAPSANVG